MNTDTDKPLPPNPPGLLAMFERFTELSRDRIAIDSYAEWLRLRVDIPEQIKRLAAFADLGTDKLMGHLAGRTATQVHGDISQASTSAALPTLAEVRDIRRDCYCNAKSDDMEDSYSCTRPKGHAGFHIAHGWDDQGTAEAYVFWKDGSAAFDFDDPVRDLIDPKHRCGFIDAGHAEANTVADCAAQADPKTSPE